MNKRDMYTVVAFFILIQILVIIRDVVSHEYWNLIWYCSMAPLFFAVGFLFKNTQFIKGVINIGIVAQAIVVIEMSLTVFFGITTPYGDLLKYGWYYIVIAFIIHLFSANVALRYTYKEKTEVKSLYYSLATLILLFVCTLIFTKPSNNVNYVFSPFIYTISSPLYTMLWIVLTFVLVVLPGYYLQRKLYHLRHKH